MYKAAFPSIVPTMISLSISVPYKADEYTRAVIVYPNPSKFYLITKLPVSKEYIFNVSLPPKHISVSQ